MRKVSAPKIDMELFSLIKCKFTNQNCLEISKNLLRKVSAPKIDMELFTPIKCKFTNQNCL